MMMSYSYIYIYIYAQNECTDRALIWEQKFNYYNLIISQNVGVFLFVIRPKTFNSYFFCNELITNN